MDMHPHFPIYMDYGATNRRATRGWWTRWCPGCVSTSATPASRSHAWGWEAEEAVEKAREQVAALIGADPREIVWTSGATESDQPGAQGRGAASTRPRASTSSRVKTEHKAVLDTCRELERQGFEVTYLDVQARRPARPGRVQGGAAPGHHPGVGACSSNNEIGVIQDIAAIGAICREQRHHLPRRRCAGHRQGRHRPGAAAGRPDDA